MPNPKDGKKSAGFPDAEFYAQSFKKRFSKKQEIFLEACKAMKIVSVAMSSYLISFPIW